MESVDFGGARSAALAPAGVAHEHASPLPALADRGYPLVCVAPPDAKLSPNSRIDPASRGKAPARPGPDGCWRGYAWAAHQPTRPEVELWAEAGANAGIQATRFPGLDIDVSIPETAQAVTQAAREHLGPAPERLSRGCRRLLVYRTSEPFRRIALSFNIDGERQLVEMLAEGQQYLVSGVHPKGMDYRWVGRPLWEIDPQELPPVTRNQVVAFFDALQADLEAQGIAVQRSGGRGATGATPQSLLEAPSPEMVREVVDLIPNPAEWGWHDAVRMGHAVRAACGEENEADAQEIYEEWLNRWEGESSGERPRWESLASPHALGWNWLQELAAEHSDYNPAQDDFEADPNAVQVAQKLLGDEPEADDAVHRVAIEAIQYIGQVPVEGSAFPHILRKVAEKCAAIPDPLQRAHAEALFLKRLVDRIGRDSAARLLGAVNRGPDRHSPYTPEGALRLMNLGEPESRARYVVDGVIPAGSIGELVARYSMGKTWILLSVLLSVAFGRPFFGRSVAQGPVLFLPYEGQHGLRRRIAGWLVHHGFLPPRFTAAQLGAVLEGRVYIAAAPPRKDNPAFEHAITQTINQHGIVLLCSDTRNKSLGADQAEDSADTAGYVNGMLSRIAAQTGAAHIETHHSGHANKDRGRGSSAWADGVDFGYLIEGTAETFAAGGAVQLKPTKMRDDAWPEPISYRLVPVSGLTMDGVEFASAVVEPVGGADAPSQYDQFLRWLGAHPGAGKMDCRRAIGGGREKADALIEGAIRQGHVVNRGTDTHWKLHRVTAGDDFAALEALCSEAGRGDLG